MSIQSECIVGRWILSQHGGMIAAEVAPFASSSSPAFSEVPYKPLVEWKTRAFVYGASDGAKWVAISHRFLMLLFGLVWIAWLFWHWKRNRKKV
jgi:hypothetical protein